MLQSAPQSFNAKDRIRFRHASSRYFHLRAANITQSDHLAGNIVLSENIRIDE